MSTATHAGNRKRRCVTCPCLIKSRLRCGRETQPGLFPQKRSFSVVHFVTFPPSIDPKLILPSFLSALCCSSHFVPVCPTFPSLCSSVFAAAPLKIQFFTPLGCSPLWGEVSPSVIPACFLLCSWKTSRSLLEGLEGPERQFTWRRLNGGGGAFPPVPSLYLTPQVASHHMLTFY